MKKSLYILFIALFAGNLCSAQRYSADSANANSLETVRAKNPFKQGGVMVFWGWNRSVYSKSDIHFRGNGYNFQLENVIAHDRQTPFAWDIYFNPEKITIPQVNYRITYFAKDHLGITLGMDHMKYVMDQNQTAEFSGYINDPKYAGMVKNGSVNLSEPEFLTFEHTDGLNYINIGVQKYIPVLSNENLDVVLSYGGGLGALLPKSNVKLFGNERSDRFHLAGFGTDARAALSFVLWKHLVAQVEGKYGYINMPDVKTTLNNHPDKATQDFVYGQVDFGIGYVFNTRK